MFNTRGKKAWKIIVSCVILASCGKTERYNDYLLTPHRVGNIEIGEEYKKLKREEGIITEIVDLSNEIFINNIKERVGLHSDSSKVYAQREHNGGEEKVRTIICESTTYKTEENLRVGMTIKDLRKVYPTKSGKLEGGKNEREGYYSNSDLVIISENEIPSSRLLFKLEVNEFNDTLISRIIIRSY